MRFERKLIKATLVKRYKRFLADVKLETGEEVTAHCPNTGSMKSCGEPGDTIYLSYNDKPSRKLKYTWELSQTASGLVGVNTHRPNHIVGEALEHKTIPELAAYSEVKREVKSGDSRFDFKLSTKDLRKPCWVEVKNVTLLEEQTVYFPDAVSTRALKHIQTLADLVKKGDRAVIFFLVNRTEKVDFKTADHIHPDYGKALIEAKKIGVEVLVYQNKITTSEISISQSLNA